MCGPAWSRTYAYIIILPDVYRQIRFPRYFANMTLVLNSSLLDALFLTTTKYVPAGSLLVLNVRACCEPACPDVVMICLPRISYSDAAA